MQPCSVGVVKINLVQPDDELQQSLIIKVIWGSIKIYISFLTALSWCVDPECPEIKSSPHVEQSCLPSGMVTCWWVPPPAAMESGQKRCSGRFWGVFFLAFGVSEELASNMGCRIRLRALINLETPNTGWFSTGWNVCLVLTGCDETSPPKSPSVRLQTFLTLRDERVIRRLTHLQLWISMCLFQNIID